MTDVRHAGTIYHVLRAEDGKVMAGLRALIGSQPAPDLGPAGRSAFDAMMSQTPAASGVAYSDDSIGGVPGVWCRPPGCVDGAAILYLHGGAYVVGSAPAYRHLAGQIALRSNAPLFIAEYGLAPEQPFPRAAEDAAAAYRGLEKLGCKAIAIVGDSAGGGLALITAAAIARAAHDGTTARLAGVVAMSPWTDLALTGASLTTRAAHDPLLTSGALERCRDLYLGSADPSDPRASPLHGDVGDLPPLLFHVGEDEILLDDSQRFADRVNEAGGRAEVHVWEGMVHVFPANLAVLLAASEALDGIGAFLRIILGGLDAVAAPLFPKEPLP